MRRFLLLACFVAPLWGQSSSITGRVLDSAEALVPGSEVSAVALGTGTERTVKTNTQGIYNIPLLLPGEYKLTVKAAGFKTLIQNVRLEVAQTLNVDLRLEVGDLAQSVDVAAQAAPLQTGTSSLGQEIEGKQILDLPLLGRNAYALAQLAPGVRMPWQFNDLPVSMILNQFVSVNGSRGYQNEYLLDGAPNSNPGQSGPTLFPTADAVAEFRLFTNAYSAEYGRATGGVFNVATRSGTNALHGTAYDFLRNNVITANDFFTNRAGGKTPAFRFNQFGVTAGGPVTLPKVYKGHNRTFFFVDYEGVRQTQGSSFTGTMPTLLQRQGDFSQTRNAAGALVQIFDPFSTRPNPANPAQFLRDVFPGNVIPANRIDPVAKNLLPLYPIPNLPGAPFTNVGNYYFSGPSTVGQDSFGIRLDERTSDKNQIYGRVSYNRSPTVSANNYGTIGAPVPAYQTFARRGAVLDDTYVFSPTLVGNFKYGFNRLINDRVPLTLGLDLTQFGFPASYAKQVQIDVLPQISPAGYNALGAPSIIHFGMDTHSLQGNLTKNAGSHTMKFGVDIRLIRNNEIQSDTSTTFSFGPAFTQGPNPAAASAVAGNGMATFLLGVGPEGAGASQVIPAVALQNVYYAAFLQDDWKVSRKLTLNLGLRWDYESPRTDRFNELANFDWHAPSPLQVPGMNLVGGLTFVGVNGNPRGQWDRDLNNFAPRVGFAYQALSKTVVRGGFGVFYSPNFAGTGTGPGTFGLSGFQSTTNWVGSLDGVTPYRFLHDPFPDGIAKPTGSSQGLATLLGQAVSFVDRGNVTPYGLQWNLSVQHELPGNLLLETAYVGTRGVKILNSRPFNQLPDADLALGDGLRALVANPFYGKITTGALAATTVARAQLLLPYPQFLGVNAVGSTWGNSTYHSGQAKLERRFSKGFSLLATYTFSKLLDDATGAWSGENVSGAAFQDYNNLRLEKSVSALDCTHRMSVGGVWELPVGKGKPLALSGVPAALLGGWQLNTIWTVSSGNVLGMTATNTTFSQGGGQRPNWNGQNPSLDTRNIYNWFNTADFSQPAPYQFGNAPRTIPGLRADGVDNVDFSAVKNNRIQERINLQLRAEWFNFTNHPRFDLPGTALGAAGFGVVTAQANRPRTLQVALKVIF
jgi:hypothetical protein